MWAQGSGSRVPVAGPSGFMLWGLGFRVWGLGFRGLWMFTQI